MNLKKFLDRYIGIPMLIFFSLVFKLIPSRNKNIKKILFVKLNGTGDVILTLPTIKAVKYKYPEARLYFLTTNEGKAVAESSGLIDKIFLFEQKPPNMFFNFSRLLLNVYKEKFNIAIDFEQFARLSAFFVLFSKAPTRIGFKSPRQYKHYGFTTSVLFKDNIHMVNEFFRLAYPLSIKSKPKSLIPLRVSNKDKEFAKSLRSGEQILLGIHAGTGNTGTSRQWPKDRFIEIINMVLENYNNVRIVLTGSPSECKLANYIYSNIKDKNKAINLAGKTNFKTLFAIAKECDVFLSNDTGPMHIAAAMGAKTLGLFGPNTPERYGPYGKGNISIYHGCPTSPHINIHLGEIKECPNNMCMKNISVEEVYEKLTFLIESK